MSVMECVFRFIRTDVFQKIVTLQGIILCSHMQQSVRDGCLLIGVEPNHCNDNSYGYDAT